MTDVSELHKGTWIQGENGILGRKELHLKGAEIDVQKTVCFGGIGKDKLSN